MIHTVTPLCGEETGLLQSAAAQEISGEDLSSCLFFDIETTGLSAETAFVFLIGCICRKEGIWQLHQFLIRYVQEERSMLSSFFALARDCRTLIHFNGSSFDLPFLAKRASAHQISSSFFDLPSVDLYQRFRPLKKLYGLPHLNQRSLEDFLGWKRTDEQPSKEMVRLYWSYSVSNDPETEQLLLGHNRDDLLGMLRLLSLEAYPALARGKAAFVLSAEESSDHSALCIRFQPELPLPRPYASAAVLSPDPELPRTPDGKPASYHLSVSGSEGQIRIPILSGSLKYFLPDYKNYEYLPLEHQIVHKSVSAYVDKKYRKPATPETCFVEKKGRFLPQPSSLFSPVFREKYESKGCYFLYEPDFLTKKQDLLSYTQVLLQFIFSL